MAGQDAAGGAGIITDGLSDIEEVVNDLLIARYGEAPDDIVPAARLVQAVRLALSVPDARLSVPPDDVTWPGADLQRPRCSRPATCSWRRWRRSSGAAPGVGAGPSTVSSPRPGRPCARRPALRSSPNSVIATPWCSSTSFQDTDRVQWDIFSDAFVVGGSPTTVVLVGDPKQSIYRFRSADLGAYLDAVAAAGDQVWSLDTNRRSDAPLLGALDRLLSGTEFGDPRVRFESVLAAPENRQGRVAAPRSRSATSSPRRRAPRCSVASWPRTSSAPSPPC